MVLIYSTYYQGWGTCNLGLNSGAVTLITFLFRSHPFSSPLLIMIIIIIIFTEEAL